MSKYQENSRKVEAIETSAKQPFKPIYCRGCRSQFSWERQPERDIKSESGKIMWERWKCRICGATTIYPIKENF